MRLSTFIVPLLAAAAMASSYAAPPDTGYGSDDTRYAYVHSNESMYAVIDSIEATHANDDKPPLGTKREDTYRIRVRFDDKSYQTVTQDSLSGLRVGDSVRIERDRVRRY
jgi:hypothetical protein